jgi:uncharacterized protein
MLRFRSVHAAVLLSCSLHAAVLPVDSYVSAVEQDRAKSNMMMRGPEGPFTLVARLHPKPGISSLGRDSANDLVLPVEKAPAHVGKIDWQGERAVLRLEPGVTAVVDGKQVTSIEVSPSPAHLKIGEMTLDLSFRDSKLVVSVSDADALKGKKVNPAAWFPVNPAYRITADWVPFAEPKTIRIPDTDGGSRMWNVPGYASFVIDGKKLTCSPYCFLTAKNWTSSFAIAPPVTKLMEREGSSLRIYQRTAK